MANIALTGITATLPNPGNYLEINFAVGPVSGFAGDYPALLIGNKTSAGDATVDTVVYGPATSLQVQTEQDVIARFGTGSELHRGWKKWVAANRSTAVYMLAITESAGANATGTITWTTTAAAAGLTRIWVQDEYVEVSIATGDTVTTIAAAAKAAINARTDWAVTADNVAGVLTITAKNKGPRSNNISYSANVFGSGLATTVTPTAVTRMTGGTTEDSYATALTTIAATRYFTIVSPSSTASATQLTGLVSQVATQSLPITGIRQVVYSGHIGTSSAAITIATGQNNVRYEAVWSQNSDWTPFELACHAAANYATYEAPRPPRHNFSGLGNDPTTQATWKVPAPRDGTVPTAATITSLLNNGVTPIGVNANGTTYLVKRITSRSLNGSTNDYRIRDSHRRFELDYFGDDWLTKAALQFAGKDLADDPAEGERPAGGNVVYPKTIKAALFRLIDDYGEDGRFKNVAAIKAGTVVQRSAVNQNRVEIRVPAEPIDILDQTTMALDQAG